MQIAMIDLLNYWYWPTQADSNTFWIK